MNVSIRISQNTLSPALRKISDSLLVVQKRRLLTALGNKFRQMTAANFGVTGLYRHQAWPPLSKRYQQRIRYFGPPKLVRKGTLRSSIQMTVTSNEALVFTDVPYAAIHQFGGRYIPARPYFPVYGGPGDARLTKRAEFELQNVLRSELGWMT